VKLNGALTVAGCHCVCSSSSTSFVPLSSSSQLPGFEKLSADMLASPNRFKEWFNKPRPESTPLPLEWRKLDDQAPFMKLLVVRAMRPDRMTIAVENYVKEALPAGAMYIECDAGKSFMDVLTASLDDSTTVNPVFFILSPGSDPVHSVEILAKRNGILSDRLHRVALGQGQDVVAMSRLEIAHKEGGWVVLENIHLMPVWNMELEKKLDEFAAVGSHPDFRLFISAEPSEGIPNGILERSIKLTNEPPQGLKQNLKRAFASFEKDEFEFKDPKVKSGTSAEQTMAVIASFNWCSQTDAHFCLSFRCCFCVRSTFSTSIAPTCTEADRWRNNCARSRGLSCALHSEEFLPNADGSRAHVCVRVFV